MTEVEISRELRRKYLNREAVYRSKLRRRYAGRIDEEIERTQRKLNTLIAIKAERSITAEEATE